MATRPDHPIPCSYKLRPDRQLTSYCRAGEIFSQQLEASLKYAFIKNVTYIGQVSYKGTIHPGEQPPIVDERLWQEVNRRLERGSRVAAIGITYVRTRNGAAGMRVRVVPFRRS